MCQCTKCTDFSPEERRSNAANTYTARLNNNSNRESYLACSMLWLDAFNLCTHFGVLQRFFQFVFSKSMAIVTCCFSSAHSNFCSLLKCSITLYHVVYYELNVTKCVHASQTHQYSPLISSYTRMIDGKLRARMRERECIADGQRENYFSFSPPSTTVFDTRQETKEKFMFCRLHFMLRPT